MKNSRCTPPSLKATSQLTDLFIVRIIIGFLLAVIAQISGPECHANEPGWCFQERNPLNGNSFGYVSANGCKFVYKKQGWAFVLAAPEWKPVAYNDESKVYFTSTITDYVVKCTQCMMVSGAHDVDSAHWGKAQRCLLNGKPAVKYVFHSKDPDARVRTAECWFHEQIPVAPAVSEITAGLDRVPRDPHLIARIVYHSKEGDFERVMLETKDCKKVAIPADCYSYPKNYRLVSDPVQVVMGNAGKDMVDELLK